MVRSIESNYAQRYSLENGMTSPRSIPYSKSLDCPLTLGLSNLTFSRLFQPIQRHQFVTIAPFLDHVHVADASPHVFSRVV